MGRAFHGRVSRLRDAEALASDVQGGAIEGASRLPAEERYKELPAELMAYFDRGRADAFERQVWADGAKQRVRDRRPLFRVCTRKQTVCLRPVAAAPLKSAWRPSQPFCVLYTAPKPDICSARPFSVVRWPPDAIIEQGVGRVLPKAVAHAFTARHLEELLTPGYLTNPLAACSEISTRTCCSDGLDHAGGSERFPTVCCRSPGCSQNCDNRALAPWAGPPARRGALVSILELA